MAGLRLLLEDSGGATELAWPGGLELAGIDPGGRPPHSNVGDQLGRHVSIRLGSPGRRFSFGVEADLVGELGDYFAGRSATAAEIEQLAYALVPGVRPGDDRLRGAS